MSGLDGAVLREASQAAVATCADGFVVLDAEGRILAANASFARQAGRAAADLLGAGFADDEIAGDPAALRATLAGVAAAGPTVTAPRARRRGDAVWHAEYAIAHSPADGGRWLVYCRDVTRRVLDETLLAARAEIARRGVTGGLDEVIQRTLDTAEQLTGSTIGFMHFVEANQRDLTLQCWSTNTLQRMCKAHGKGAHYPIHQAGVWVDCVRTRAPVIHNDYATLPHRRGLPAGHAPVIRELVIPVLRGEAVIAILGVGNKPTPYTDDDVELASRLADLCIDIVTRKRVEEQLRASEARFRHLYESGAQGVLYLDERFQVLEANPAAERLLGAPAAELRTRGWLDPRWDVVDAHGRALAADERPLTQLARTGAPVRGAVIGVRRADTGERAWVQLGATRRADPGGGERWHVCLTLEDITAQRQAEQDSLARERRTQRIARLASLRGVAGGVAHDFNNIFSGAIGHLELAAAELPLTSSARADLDAARAAIARAATLSQQMLVAAGAAPLQPTATRWGDVLGSAAGPIARALPAHVALEVIDAGAPPMAADAGLLRRVAEQLLRNAVEAMGDAPGVIRLATGEREVAADELRRASTGEAVPAGRYATLTVTDTGHGMDAATIARLFEPFFTTRFTGRGLGLPEVLGIVRAHRGALVVDSAPGRGTSVLVLIPVAPALALPAHAPAPAPAAAAHGHHVLIVDDEPVIGAVGRRALERAGHPTYVALGGREALELFLAHRAEIGLVVLDVCMPDVSGVDVLAQLRQLAPALPVVMSSGYSEQTLRDQLASLPTQGFLAKPYSTRALIDAAHAHLAAR